MKSYRKSAHTTYRLHYHFVFIPKYRKPVLRGDVGRWLRELIREICHAHDVEIIKGHIRPDHVHLLLSVPPPNMAPSKVMQAIKGKISHRLLRDLRRIKEDAQDVPGTTSVGSRLLRYVEWKPDRRGDQSLH